MVRISGIHNEERKLREFNIRRIYRKQEKRKKLLNEWMTGQRQKRVDNGSNFTEIKKQVVKSHDCHCNKGTWNIIFNAFKIRGRYCIRFPTF